MPEFIQGRELSRVFYVEAVRPLLDRHFPDLPHAAGRLGGGSDVLGFDTPMSRDHDWGPTVHLLLCEADMNQAAAIRDVMAAHLPHEIRGYSTHFGYHDSDGTRKMDTSQNGSINHRVIVMSVRDYIWRFLRWNSGTELAVADWLSFPSQELRAVTQGWVHHDSAGEWTAVRERLVWYPHDVWVYLMAASWMRIGQEDHLHGRAGDVGDELGSRLIAARLVRDVMQLCFLQGQQYAPYPKWFGSAFQQLACASDLTPILRRAQSGETWQLRESALVEAFEYAARQHNALQITKPVRESAAQFFDRPFTVITNNGIADILLDAITDPQVKRLQALPSLIGSIDQFSDSTDLRSCIDWREKIRALYLT